MAKFPALLIATENTGKLSEFELLLRERFRCINPGEPGLSSIHAPKVVEDGSTYYENALKKAVAYFRSYQTPVLSDDSGLEVDAFSGAPGILSARFGGETLAWRQRWDLMLKALHGVPEEKRTARFRCVLCYYAGNDVPRFFEGTCEGRITLSAKGSAGFGYDPIFYAFDLEKTFGEAADIEKHQVSHRARAVQQFCLWYFQES